VERYRCPRCGDATVTFWQKQFGGAALRAGCSACGARLAVPLGRAMLVATLAIFVPMLAAILVYAAWYRYAAPMEQAIWRIYAALLVGLLLGGILAIWIRHRFVPIICIDEPSAAAADPAHSAIFEGRD